MSQSKRKYRHVAKLYAVAYLLALTLPLAAQGRLFPIFENGKAGYIDRTGKVIIKPTFDEGGEFSEGLAPVMVDKKQLNPSIAVGKWGYIDQKGNWVIKPTFDYAETFSEGLGVVEIDGKNGYVNRSGTMVIEPQFSSANAFHDGVARVYKAQNNVEACVFIDKTGKPLFRVEDATSVYDFSEGQAPVAYQDSKKYGYVNKEGAISILEGYSGTDPFYNGFAPVWKNNKMGFIDAAHNLVIPFRFKTGEAFSEGLAPVELGEKWGFIDQSGKFVIQPRFDEANSFFNGFAAVSNGEAWGFINKKGHLVVDYKFHHVDPFIDGIARVDDVSFLIGYINTRGSFVWKAKNP